MGGVDNVVIAFSGGKDSTVLLDICRRLFPTMKAAFVDTGLEYPEIRNFVLTKENVDWIKPKMNFRKVIQEYGYPFISKEVSMNIEYAKKYIDTIGNNAGSGAYAIADLLGIPRRGDYKDSEMYAMLKEGKLPIGFEEYRPEVHKDIIEMFGRYTPTQEFVKNRYTDCYKKTKWSFMLMCPEKISNKCCTVMKKEPFHNYSRITGRKQITAQTASESRLRTQHWLTNGCNAFDSENPTSNPMSFWTEQDVLLYIYENNIEIASIYGNVVREDGDELCGCYSDRFIFDNIPVLTTTGVDRTGCMFCGFGCHNEPDGEGRFERMKATHPKQYNYIMKPCDDGGLGYKELIEWINRYGENSNVHINM